MQKQYQCKQTSNWRQPRNTFRLSVAQPSRNKPAQNIDDLVDLLPPTIVPKELSKAEEDRIKMEQTWRDLCPEEKNYEDKNTLQYDWNQSDLASHSPLNTPSPQDRVSAPPVSSTPLTQPSNLFDPSSPQDGGQAAPASSTPLTQQSHIFNPSSPQDGGAVAVALNIPVVQPLPPSGIQAPVAPNSTNVAYTGSDTPYDSDDEEILRGANQLFHEDR
jgi:hypothetical protein